MTRSRIVIKAQFRTSVLKLTTNYGILPVVCDSGASRDLSSVKFTSSVELSLHGFGSSSVSVYHGMLTERHISVNRIGARSRHRFVKLSYMLKINQ